MNLWSWLFGRRAAPQVAIELPSRDPLTSPPLRISEDAISVLRGRTAESQGKAINPFHVLYEPAPGVRPANDPKLPSPVMAMDSAQPDAVQFLSTWATSGLWGEGQYFPGYPYLAELAQRPEYRHISGTIAGLLTRKWIKLNSKGKDDKADKIAKIEDAMKRYNLRDAFHRVMVLDGIMGMGMIYPDLGVTDDPAELRAPLLLDDKRMLKAAKVPKGSLRGFVVVDPTWVSPVAYNSTDPLKPDFYIPSMWYVMGKQVHASRLLVFRSRELPDILKAAYNFGGLSMSQMAKPYVDNWLRTRQSVSDLLHAFTTWVLATNMGSYLQDASELLKRLSAFILGRDNKGLMMIDKETEALTNISAPLGTLDKLQAQAQEQMASVSQLTLVWLLGVTPTGLNATTDGEIRVQYDRAKSTQENVMGAHVTTCLELIQLSEFGSIDTDIGFEFLPLWELDEAGRAAVQKTRADTDAVYMTEGVISPEEARDRLAADPESPYNGLEGPPPEPPEVDPNDPDMTDTTGKIDAKAVEGSESGANSGV